MAEAPSPWSARAAISAPPVGASAHTAENAPNRMRPTM